ncbi:MAG: metallophosphatase family protein [Clostridium sp.]|nr:metallophosphatase family protein [Clostridium sp.]
MARIGVISDTHGLLRENVIEQLKKCDVILHAGDIQSESIIKQLNAIAKTYAVQGNTDKNLSAGLPAALHLELYGLRIFMIHNQKHIHEDIRNAQLVIYGHSHRYEMKSDNGQVWLNPGSCGPRRFTLPVTMAVIDIDNDGSYKINRIDLCTGTDDIRPQASQNLKDIIVSVMHDVDKSMSIADIARHNHIDEELATQICRLYLTHPGVTSDGILNKMDNR